MSIKSIDLSIIIRNFMIQTLNSGEVADFCSSDIRERQLIAIFLHQKRAVTSSIRVRGISMRQHQGTHDVIDLLCPGIARILLKKSAEFFPGLLAASQSNQHISANQMGVRKVNR